MTKSTETPAKDRGRDEYTAAPSAPLGKALQACQQAARQAYRDAQSHLRELEDAIEGAAQKVKAKREELAGGRVRTFDVDVKLQTQLVEIVGELHELQTEFRKSLDAKGEQLDEFSIALFGRTMCGKSTLMEILTGGDGTTIGAGAQRTTRDVRAYRWQGLRITDVPGVAAFEGSEDEESAFEAAAHADLVIFLITDDAPQTAEADCFARVRKLGKPVLGVCNVKFAINEDDDLKLLRSLARRHFDSERLRAVINQFSEFADKRLPRNRTRFVCAHLRARFLAQRQSDRERSKTLAELSRFENVKKEIVAVVAKQGTFLRRKSFIDASVVPTLNLSDSLLDLSAQNASSGRVLVGKRRQTVTWCDGFRTSGRIRIEKGVREVGEGLRKLIPSFAEDHYDGSDAGDHWSREVQKQNVEEAAQRVQKSLLAQCQAHFDQIANEFKEELKLVGDFAADTRIAMDPIFDGKRAWMWGTTLTSGGLAIAAGLLFSNPLGWAAAGVGIVGAWLSKLFEDREKKANRQRRELEAKLRKDVNRIEKRLRKALRRWFKDTLLGQVDDLLDDMSTVIGSLFELADTQRNLAWELNRKQKPLHRKLLFEAWDQLDAQVPIPRIKDIARVPGDGIMLVLDRGVRLPDDVRESLKRLFGEPVWLMAETDSPFWTLCKAIGVRGKNEIRGISIEEKIQVAHVPVGILDAGQRARIRLAQQLTELHVMKAQSL